MVSSACLLHSHLNFSLPQMLAGGLVMFTEAAGEGQSNKTQQRTEANDNQEVTDILDSSTEVDTDISKFTNCWK